MVFLWDSKRAFSYRVETPFERAASKEEAGSPRWASDCILTAASSALTACVLSALMVTSTA